MRDDLVSVLMTVYNTEVDYLDTAIKSVLTQTYENIELIIIDDASDNKDIVEYLSELTDKRIHVFRNNENVGLTKSLNIGLKLCNGRYVARLDSDDISAPNRIAEQYNIIKKYDCILVASNWKIFPIYKKHPLMFFDKPEYRVSMVLGNQGPCHSAFFIDKVRMDTISLKYDEKYDTSQDYAFLCDCISLNEKIRYSRKTLVWWREHTGQISVTRKIAQEIDASRIRISYIHKNFNLTVEEAKQFVAVIGEETYKSDCYVEYIQEQLFLFLNRNPNVVVDRVIHKYWFRQSLVRIKKTRRFDFAQSRLFLNSLRLDRLLYILISSIVERIHYLYQTYIKI